MMRTIFFLTLLASGFSINPIVIKGRKFFDSVTKQQFYVKGVDYQPSWDPITDIAGLQRDIPYLQQLGVNTIRCYQTDYTQNHDAGMKLLADAGIYVIVDLSDPDLSISAWPEALWTTTLFDNFRKKANSFAGYTNTFGFIAANEVIWLDGSSVATPLVKAAIRDLKIWLKQQGHSKPVGYAAADVPEADQVQSFLNCNNPDDSADFYGVNIYRWCGASNGDASGYSALAARWASYSIPFIFTEFGCNTPRLQAPPQNRPFTEIQAIYGPLMQDVLSGGLVYEWHQEVNDYGLVQISADGSSLTPHPEFNILKNQWASVNPTVANLDSYDPSNLRQEQCPAVDNKFQAQAAPLPQTPNFDKCSCMYSQLSCRTATQNFNDRAHDKAYVTVLESARNQICTENPESCWPTGTAPEYASYGVWSDCNYHQRISYIMDARYKAHGNNPAFCSYDGISTQIAGGGGSQVCTDVANSFSFEGAYVPPPASSGTSTSGSSTTSGNAGSQSGAGTGSDGSGSHSGSGGSSQCGAGLSACGADCYSPSQYCCQGGQLKPAGQCTTVVETQPSTIPTTTLSSTTTGGQGTSGLATLPNQTGGQSNGGQSNNGQATLQTRNTLAQTSAAATPATTGQSDNGAQQPTVIRQQGSSASFMGAAWGLLTVAIAFVLV